ncbi:MAG: polyprenol monophosphomannose synthase [Actinobacteria bacterium]|nr:MAG: polyprenol monophosphomannose synthase [Actinomycetota bacterium]
MSGVWLVVPTYNEAENLEPIVEAATSSLATCAPEHRLLIVDDKSPDGTGELADRLAGEREAVEVLHRRRKEGIGPAYLEGFRRALEGGADLVLEMDADFSHDPGDIPRLVEASADADLVLGSRYMPGGGVAGWNRRRRLLSRGGCWYARTVLGVPVRDLTGGFKCFRRQVLETLDLSGIHADGYGFQIEMTYRAIRAGFRVREIPITFHDRRAGASKMDTRIAAEAVWKVPALRWRLRGSAASAG